MFLFRQNGIILLKFIFFQETLPICDLHVKQGVPDAKEGVRLSGHRDL
jgi:hypothetical protein